MRRKLLKNDSKMFVFLASIFFYWYFFLNIKNKKGDMGSRFERFMTVILDNEGGYVANDAGAGPSKFGINDSADGKKDGLVDASVKVKDLSVEAAKAIYKKNYYDKCKVDSIDDEKLALQVFDMSVNAGVYIASKLLQNVVGATPDGVIGLKTLSKANSMSSAASSYADARRSYYRIISSKKPAMLKYLNSWLNRVDKIENF